MSDQDSPGARNEVYVVVSNWFVNRCPLITRLPRVPLDAVEFRAGGRTQYRQAWKKTVRDAAQGDVYTPSDGVRTPFDQAKMTALQDLVDDMELSSYYGVGRPPIEGARSVQDGLKSLLPHTLTGRAADAYTASDFVNDALTTCRTAGGDPDVLIVSANFQDAFAAWGRGLMRIDAGVNVFGVPIGVFETPFLGGISIIVAPLLRPFTAVALTSSDVRMRMKKNESFEDNCWVAEGAIQVDHPEHHAWIDGVKAFAAG